MNKPEGNRRVLTATEQDVALVVAWRHRRNSTVGEALEMWGNLPRETRERIIGQCRKTAAIMFDIDAFLVDVIKEKLQESTGADRQPAYRGPGLIYGGGQRLAIIPSTETRGKYAPYSPRNDHEFAEGAWDHWVELAKNILDEDAKNRRLNEEAAQKASA